MALQLSPMHPFLCLLVSLLEVLTISPSLKESRGFPQRERERGREKGKKSTSGIGKLYMESINGNRGVAPSTINLGPEALSRLQEGIWSLFSRWNGLQMAIQNEWGGRDSLQKSHQLAADILSWVSQSKAPLCIQDLENSLHESLLLSFNTEILDGSIEEVAEQLMMLHEDFLQGNHFSQ